MKKDFDSCSVDVQSSLLAYEMIREHEEAEELAITANAKL